MKLCFNMKAEGENPIKVINENAMFLIIEG